MADIFISFAKADRNLAQQLAAQLEAQGRTTWWDADVGGGHNSRSAIDRELDSAHKVIVIWSKASIASPFVLHEAITARDAGKLVQVKTSDIQVSDIPRPLRALQPLNASDMASITSAVNDHARKPNAPAAQVMLQGVEAANASHTAPSGASISPTRRLPGSNEKSGAWVYALAVATVAAIAAGVIWQPELSDGLSAIATKLLEFLK
jgi:hypothetical protein